MKLREIKAVLRLLEGSDVTEFEYQDDAVRMTVRRGHAVPAAPAPSMIAMAPAQLPVQAGPAVAGMATETPTTTVPTVHVVTSPFVGTFYRTPAPDADLFVKVGQQVEVGDTLCIVEAMKLMNEIEADVAGTVRKALVENGQPVEFDQELFVIDPA
jgi:acetyl-CoA carboxylase biotin carboxyl carrier protein